MKGKLHMKLSGREKDYYDQGIRELRAGRPSDALTSFNCCKTILRGSFMALDECIVKASTELGREDYLKTKNSAWFVKASDGSIRMCEEYGKDSYVVCLLLARMLRKPWLRRAKVLEAGKLYQQSLAYVDKVLAHPDYAKADPKVHASVIEFEKRMRTILRTRRLLKENEAEIKQLEKDLKAEMIYKRTTNFIQQLSHDTLLLIADAGLGMDPGFALRMAGVNREWRALVTGRAGLWDELALGHHRPAKKAQLWINRSGGRLRKVRVRTDCPADIIPDIIEILEPALRNVERLTMDEMSNPSRGHLALVHRFHGLRSIELRSETHSWHSVGLDDELLAHDCRTLREVNLSGALFTRFGIQRSTSGGADEISKAPSRAFAGLQTLRMSKCISADEDVQRDLQRFIQCLGDLRRLVVDRYFSGPFRSDNAASSGDQEVIPMDHLEHYQISQGYGPRLECRMPRLSAFNCYGSLYPASLLFPYIFSYIQPFSTALTSLDIGGISLDNDGLLPLLQSLPTIKFLGVSRIGLDDKFLAQLSTATDDAPMPLPNLEAISLAGNEFTTLGVRDFVMKRVPLSEWVAAAPPPPPTIKKSGGAFRPAKVARTGNSAFGPSASAPPSKPTTPRGGLLSGRPPPPTMPGLAPSGSLVATSSPAAASPSLSAPSPLSSPALAPATSIASNIATQGSQTPGDQPISRIQWINLDACQLIDPSLQQHLTKFVRFVSIAPGPLNEDRVRAKGMWSWQGDWKNSCTYASNCRLIPAHHKKEEWEVRHYCTPDAAAEGLKMPNYSQRPKSR